jgi:AAA domain
MPPDKEESRKLDQALDPRRLLVDWANGQDGWLRRLVGIVLASRRPASDAQIAELYELYLAEKGLRGEPPDQEPDLAYPTDGAAAAQELRLTRLSQVAGVNALTPGSEIEFCDGLTVLYGENGTGKTGYARVLKRMGALRDPEEIVPNIHDNHSATPTAQIEFRLGDAEGSLTWRNEVGVSPFTRMSIFDSPAVNVRVDENLTYVFTPAEISLFDYVNAGIRALQELGARSLRDLTPTTNPFVRYFQRGTVIYQQIEALGAATDLPAIEALAAPPPNAQDEKERLDREVAALKSNIAEGMLAGHRESVRTLQTLAKTAEAIETFNRDGYNEELAALGVLRNSYRRVREESFVSGELPGPPDDDWQGFVAAGAEYQQHLGLLDYPHDGDRCLYCRQALTPSALALIRRYATFLDDALTRQIADQERKVDALAAALAVPGAGDLTATIQRQRERGGDGPVYDIAERFATVLAAAREQVSSRARLVDESLPELSAAVRVAVAAPLATHQADVVLLEQQLADRGKALQEAEAKLRELVAQIELERRMPEINLHVASTKQAVRLELLLKRMSGLLRSLTEVSKTASEDLVNRDFEARFSEECRALRTPTVELEFIGREGKAQRRKTLSTDYRLSQILSEGEQKVLALADFIAEAGMGGSSAPIIFDDPVNSLDHRRLQEVADRIAALVATRQVVVFTHNIWLATELLARFEKRPQECSYFMVSDDEARNVKGKVDRASGPRWDTVKELKKRVDEHLQDAAAASGASQTALVEAAYGVMRSWCEVVVEEVLFADVTRRYRANVMMGSLKNVRPERLAAAIAVIGALFDRACRFIPDHSQPLPTLSTRPTVAEAQTDWQAGQDAVKAYRQQ